MVKGTTVSVNLKADISYDNIPTDIQKFDDSARLVDNNNIDRNGGSQNLNITEITNSIVGNYFYTENGDKLALDTSGVVYCNDQPIGTVSPYGVEKRNTASGVDDTILTSTGYITANLVNTVLTLTEYNDAGVQINTRSITFQNISTIVPFITSLSIVRTASPAWGDTFEFVVRVGDLVAFISESNTNILLANFMQSSKVIGSSQINATATVGSILYFGGANGRVGSFDGTNWKNYDGTGVGLGGYNSGTAMGSVSINAMCAFNSVLIVAGNTGRLASFDGTNWKNYDGTGGGTGFYSSTVIGSNAIYAVAKWNSLLMVGGQGGRVGAIDSSTTYLYNGTTIAQGMWTPAANATVIGANDIKTFSVINTGIEGGFNPILLAGGAGGQLASFDGSWCNQAGTPSLAITSAVANIGTISSATANSTNSNTGNSDLGSGVYYFEGYFYTPQGNKIYRSRDAITWGVCNTPSTMNGASRMAFGNGLFVCIASTAGHSASNSILISTDGVNFSFITTAPITNLQGLEDISFGNGYFIVTGKPTSSTTAAIYRSTDGFNWSAGSHPALTSLSFVVNSGSYWCAGILNAGGINTSVLRSSDNGSTWSFATSPAITAATYCAAINATFMITDALTNVYRSTDGGANWSAVALPTAPGGRLSVTASTEMFYASSIAFGTTINSVYTSPDGSAWTARTVPSGFQGQSCYALGKFITVKSLTNGASSVYSTQGINYINASSETTQFLGANNINASAYDGNLYSYIGAAAGKVGSLSQFGFLDQSGFNSAPFTQMQPVNIPTSVNITNQGLVGMAYGNNVHVALLGINSTTQSVMRSVDGGRTWNFVTCPAYSGNWIGITYGNGTFMLVSATTSTTQGVFTYDGNTSFSAKTTGTPAGNWQGIAYGSGIFTLIALTTSTTAGIAYTSNNGTSWNFATTSAPANAWIGITYGLSNFVAVASTTSTTAGIAYSANASSWTFATTTAPASAWVGVAGRSTAVVAIAGTTSTTAGIAYSTSIATWAFATTTAPISSWLGVTVNNGKFIAYNNGIGNFSAAIATSSDGSNWSFKTNPISVSYPINKVFASDNLILGFGLVNLNGKIVYIKTHSNKNALNTGSAVNSQAITAMSYFNNQVIVGAGSGLVASFDGTNWKNYDGTGTGTGPYINGTPALAIGAMGVSPDGMELFFGYSSGFANGMNKSWQYSSTDGSGNFNPSAFGAKSNNYLYAFKYSNGFYIWHIVNSANNSIFLSSAPSISYQTILGKYAYPETVNGLTRHIISETPRGDSFGVYALSLVGYTDFSTFSITQVYPQTNVDLTGSGGVQQGAIGWNYGDVTFKTSSSAVNIFNYYGPQPSQVQTALYQITQGNTNNLITGYGKLSNTIAVTSPVEFRLNWLVAGTQSFQSFISAAINDGGGTDALGVLLTGVGEFDDTYTPMVIGNKILYKYNGNFYTIKISTNPTLAIQQVNDRLYKINTISPLNLYDSNTKTLIVSSTDYQGRVKWNYTGTPATVSNSFTAVYYNTFTNSIDNGAKLNYISSPSTANFVPFGIRVPYSTTLDFTIDEFVDTNYIGSYDNSGYSFTQTNPFTVIYSSVETIPYPIGFRLNFGSLVNDNSDTLVLNRDYDAYTIGNTIPGTFQASFILFGQTYLYDGLAIYLATIVNNIVASYDKVTDAYGLNFIAQTPEVIYFMSSFDNSLYTFNGGKSVIKSMCLVNMDTVSNGVYNAKENTLMLNATNHFITLRDGQLTQILKNANQTGALTIYSTINGLIISNNSKSWQYTYYATGSSTPVPFMIQTGFYGLRYNEKCILDEFVVTLYDTNKSARTINCIVFAYDESTSYTDKMTVTVGASDYTALGNAKFRIQPKRMKALAVSLKVECAQSLFVTDIEMNYNDAEQAGIRNSR